MEHSVVRLPRHRLGRFRQNCFLRGSVMMLLLFRAMVFCPGGHGQHVFQILLHTEIFSLHPAVFQEPGIQGTEPRIHLLHIGNSDRKQNVVIKFMDPANTLFLLQAVQKVRFLLRIPKNL